MYTHAATRAHILASQNRFQSYVHLHADELVEFVLHLCLQQVFIVLAASVTAWVYMRAAVRLSSTMAVVELAV